MLRHFAEDILQLLKDPFSLPTAEKSSSAQVLVSAFYPEHGQTPKELLQQADAAMYRAKAHGRSCFRYFSDELTRAAEQRLDLEVRLQRALRLNELCLYFQPQIDISSNRIMVPKRWFAGRISAWPDLTAPVYPGGRRRPG